MEKDKNIVKAINRNVRSSPRKINILLKNIRGKKVDVAVRDRKQVNGIIGAKIIPTKDIPELKVEDYNFLILPGGAKAMEYMRQDVEIIKFILFC